MEVVDSFYGEYKDDVDQGKLHAQGKSYLDAQFPKLDYLLSCELVKRVRPAQAKKPAALL